MDRRYRSAAFVTMALVMIAGCAEAPEPEPPRAPAVRYTPPPAPVPVPAPAQQPAQTTSVYIAPDSGECFHSRPQCSGLQRARSIQPVSRDQAVARGLRPCRICNP